MDDRIATVHVYKDTELLLTTQIFGQWLNLITDVYLDWEDSPYNLVIEYDSKTLKVNNAGS
jgi:regulator of sigma D